MSPHLPRRVLTAFLALVLMLLPTRTWAWPQEFIASDVSSLPPEEIAAAWGLDLIHVGSHWAENGILGVQLIACSAPAGIAFPGEQPTYTFQFSNRTAQAVAVGGRVRVIQYELFTKGDDVFALGIRRMADCGTTPIRVEVGANGWCDVTVAPQLPERKGGYVVIIELDGQPALFGAGTIRTFKPASQAPRQFYRLTMDLGETPVLIRLGVTQNRVGFPFKAPSDADFEAWYQQQTADLRKLQAAHLPVCVEFGCGPIRDRMQPLGRARPWLNDQNELLDTKSDYAWLPSYDHEFTALAKRVATDFGWPKGPVNAMKVWNEPWNGISISGWGADDERYREIYGAMCEGVEAARADAGVQVLVGGCDSSSNTFDKLFSDGTTKWLPRLDFLSIHYQGTDPHSMVKMWRDRKGPDGKPSPVLIWDTESWVANSDDRVAGVLASMFAFGQDRVVGIQGDSVVAAIRDLHIHTANGQEERRINHTWSVGAAVGAFQHFVGERPFKELLFRPGLPCAMRFSSENPEDTTVVVVGDLGSIYGADNVAFRTCRPLAEVREKEELRTQLAKLPATSPERAALETRLATPQPWSGCHLTLPADARYGLFDFYGNALPASDGLITVPLDARGFYLRADGTAGSAAALISAVKTGRITGLSPVALQLVDAQSPITAKPVFSVALTNVLNHPITGRITATISGLTLTPPEAVTVLPGATITVPLAVTGGIARPDNRYPCRVVADFGADGLVATEEEVRVDLINRRTIAVDGKLDDWTAAIPQPVEFTGAQTTTLTEKAWLPFVPADEAVKKGVAVGWLAYDERHFYFAARINDTTPSAGMPRFSDPAHWDEYFYPQISHASAAPCISDASIRWTGQVVASVTGDYRFATVSDDGVRLWVAGKQLIDNWTSHGPAEDAGTLKLEGGKRYDLKLEWFQGGGGAKIQLLWTPPGKDRELIPPAALFTTGDAAAIQGLSCTVFRGTDLMQEFLTRTDPQIDFTWSEGPLTTHSFTGGQREDLVWPEGVRRFSYRANPMLPNGNAPNADNVQLAFNVLPPEAKSEYPCPPGTFPGFTSAPTTDYEYALNTVAQRYGGGTEVWRLATPAMPPKHFYPRDPGSPADGAVPGAQLVTSHVGATRIVECAIPWAELPEVHAAMLAGTPVRFTFRVNDDAGVGCLELARGRSISRRGRAFHADWVEHWENQLQFGWEK